MDVSWQFKLITLFILLFFSAFFSGSEVALFSLDRRKLKNKLNNNPLIGRYLLNLIDHPRRLLVTILIGNTLVNVAVSIIAVSLALEYYHSNGRLSKDLILIIQVISVTILIIIFGELVPKLWATKKPLTFSKVVTFPLYFISIILYPIAESLTEMIRVSVAKIKIDKSKAAILPEEIPHLADLGHERGTIEQNEHGLIQSIVSFRSVTVHEVMTPRMDMVTASVDITFDDLLQVITTSGYSRIPLFKNDLDKIVGIIYAKDLLPYIGNIELRRQFNPSQIARKAMFIPKTKMINDLMYEFQEKKMHIAIVVDEYGGTAGLISLEDIIEEIIGEIRDEYDKEENPVTKLNDYSYLVLGKISIYELNELLNTQINFSNEDFETLAGLVLNQAGHIPREGYFFQLENYRFTVKEVFKKRINKVLIEKIKGE